jgi:glycosyl transferase family 1/glycosyl transferase family 4
MRILHLDAGKEMRGGQWQVLRLIEGLASAGVESTLLAREGFPLFDAVRQQGWRVEPLSLTRAVMMARNHAVMHAHDAHGHTLGAIVRGLPLVVSRRVAFAIGTNHISSRWKYGRAKHYLAVSAFVKGVLVQGGVAAEKISVVYDGVPVLEQARGTAVLAMQKGTTLAAEAARIARIEVKIAGDLEQDLRTAGIFVYISHSEGLGSGVLLAMSAGVPVVASNVGGLPEVVQHRENGLLVENSPEAIAEGIRELTGDPAFARKLAQAGRHTMTERFTVELMVNRTLDVYRKVLA